MRPTRSLLNGVLAPKSAAARIASVTPLAGWLIFKFFAWYRLSQFARPSAGQRLFVIASFFFRLFGSIGQS
jgi:hypothetical protein